MRLTPLLALASIGCGSMTPSMAYHSSETSEKIPAKITVRVSVSPPAPVIDDDFSNELESGDEQELAQSMKTAVEDDIRANGPFEIDDVSPDAVLDLRVGVAAVGDTTAWLGLPPWIWAFAGLPIYSRKIAVNVDAKLLHGAGAVLAEAFAREDCTKYSGLYYGYSVTFSCAVEPVMENIRALLSQQKDVVVAKLDKLGRVQIAAAPPPPMPVKPGAVLAVFDIEDTKRVVSDDAAGEITEYLSTKVAERLNFRIVPRAQLRERLVEAKAEGYKSCFDASCQIELGKALAAEKTLATRVLKVGKTCAMTTTLYDLKTETAERAASVKTDCSEDALMAGVDRVVDQLAGK